MPPVERCAEPTDRTAQGGNPEVSSSENMTSEAKLDSPVATLMTREVKSVRPNTPVEDAARLLLQHQISGMPVLDDRGAVVGVVTLTDIAKRLRGGDAE